MGRGVDFNYIFFGRHEGGHRSATAAMLLLVVILAAYTYTNQASISSQEIEMQKKPDTAAFCQNYAESESEISCEEAVSIAMSNTAGSVQKVSMGSVRTLDPLTSPPTRIVKEMWLVDIKLENPHFDQNFGREVLYLRLGIGLDGNSAISKEVIDV